MPIDWDNTIWGPVSSDKRWQIKARDWHLGPYQLYYDGKQVAEVNPGPPGAYSKGIPMLQGEAEQLLVRFAKEEAEAEAARLTAVAMKTLPARIAAIEQKLDKLLAQQQWRTLP